MTALAEIAAELDRTDPLAPFRSRFTIPDDHIYLDGNSLGRPPTAAIEAVRRVTEDEWPVELIGGWDHWLDVGLRAGDDLADLTGAADGEIAVCDQTSINLYKLVTAALDHSRRNTIVTSAGNFPSDLYVLERIALRERANLVILPGHPTIDEISAAVDESTALVALTHVDYRSAAMFDGAAITGVAHDAGATMLWDLAHSAGAVPVDLAAWDADLAVGCTYKYLNGGPGAPGYLYVRRDLQATLECPIAGWFAHDDQFAFSERFVPSASIRRFQVGTPSIISLVAAHEGIKVSREAGIDSLVRKSAALSTLFLDAIAAAPIDIASPRDTSVRGSHVSLRHPAAFQISSALRNAGVFGDHRTPDVVRLGFAPLYTRHADVVRAAGILTDLLEDRSYERFPPSRSGVI